MKVWMVRLMQTVLVVAILGLVAQAVQARFKRIRASATGQVFEALGSPGEEVCRNGFEFNWYMDKSKYDRCESDGSFCSVDEFRAHWLSKDAPEFVKAKVTVYKGKNVYEKGDVVGGGGFTAGRIPPKNEKGLMLPSRFPWEVFYARSNITDMESGLPPKAPYNVSKVIIWDESLPIGTELIIEIEPRSGYSDYFEGWAIDGDLDGDDVNTDEDFNPKVANCVFKADLSLTKTVDKPTAGPGDTVVFSLQVKNNGPYRTKEIEIQDKLPSGYTYVSDDGGGAYDKSTGTWAIQGLEVGDSATLKITARVNASGEYENTARITNSMLPDANTENNQASAAVSTKEPEADLSLTKTADKASAIAGDNVVFTLRVSNAGPDQATGVQVADKLPSGYTYVTDSGGGKYNSSTGLWNVGAIKSGKSATLQITARLEEGGDHKNVVEVTASDLADPDSKPDNDDGDQSEDDEASANVSVAGAPTADLSLDKSVDDDSAQPGENAVFTLQVSNAGPDQATGVQVVDKLPGGYTYVGDDGGGDYDQSTGLWNVGSIASGQSNTLRITARVEEDGGYQNVAEVAASDQPDPDSTPDNGSQGEDDQDDASVAPGVVPSGIKVYVPLAVSQ